MNKKFYKGLSVLVMLASVAACGNKSTDEIKQQADNNVKANGNAAIKTASYASDCTSGEMNLVGLSLPGSQTVYDLSDLDFTKKQLYYSDSCKTQQFVVQEKGKVVVNAKSGAVPGALEEDFNFESTTITLKTEGAVKLFNFTKVCGISDWALDVERDVSQQSSQVTCPGKASPRTALELVLVEGSNLYLGNNSNQDATKGRPTQIDRGLVFKEQ